MFSALGSIKSSIAGFLPETVDPAAGQKSFYELKAPLPGNKEYDFVSDIPNASERHAEYADPAQWPVLDGHWTDGVAR